MSETTTSSSFLTQDAYDRLSAELEHLKGEGRSDIAKRIEAAREEGDLKENGGYHAAKEEQGKMEARIRQLESLLRDAVVGEAPKDNGIVDSGMVVTSEQSPLGEAIMGKKVGEETSYDAPNGKTIEVKIVDAKPYAG